MRFICVPSLILLIGTFSILVLAAPPSPPPLPIEQEQQLLSEPQAAAEDDTSLFWGVENVIDDDSEDDDAYRMLKSMQDVTDDSVDEDFDIPEEDEEEEKEDVIVDDDNEEEEEEEEEDLTPEFPEFQNEDTTDFFENLPQPLENIDNKINAADDTIQVEEVDEEIDELVPKDDEEDEEDVVDDEQVIGDTAPPAPALPVINNENLHWQRPDPVVKVDDNFYQDINLKESERRKYQTSPKGNYTFWYLFFVLMVLAIVYNSITKRKPNNSLELPSSSSWGSNEKDYLPLHNSSKRGSYYKCETKSS